jgi:hypothetical protein
MGSRKLKEETMRSLRLLCAIAGLAAAISLGACEPVTIGGGPSPTNDTSAKIADYVKQAQNAIVQGCSWYEPAESLARIFVSGATISSVSTVVAAVCSAVRTPAARRGGGKPAVKGVRLQGGFIRR